MSLIPGSPEWCKVVTASKVAAILGHSPFMSQRTVWHLMRGEYEQPDKAVMRRGHYLEDGVLRWWRDQHPDFNGFIPQPCYFIDDWAAATPDAYASRYGESVLVEAKTAANDDEWGRPGTDEIPTHYLTQCYWSMHVSDIHEIRVPVLTSRLRFEEYVVTHDVEVGQLLEERCRAFYDTLSADTPPSLDDSVSTFECMKQIHKDIDPSAPDVEIPYELACAFVTAALDGKDAEQRERAARIQMHDLAGTAKYLIHNGVTVARRQAAPNGGVSLVRVVKDPAELTDRNAA